MMTRSLINSRVCDARMQQREGGREEEIKAQRIEGKEVSVNKLISLE